MTDYYLLANSEKEQKEKKRSKVEHFSTKAYWHNGFKFTIRAITYPGLTESLRRQTRKKQRYLRLEFVHISQETITQELE